MVNFVRKVLAVSITIVIAAICGAVYAQLINLWPSQPVLLNFLLTCAFGYALGKLAVAASKLGRNRDERAARTLGRVAGFVGLYSAWACDPWARLEIGYIFVHPAVLWDYVVWFYETGFWSLNGRSTLAGPPLAVVWIVEALLILIPARLISAKHATALAANSHERIATIKEPSGTAH